MLKHLMLLLHDVTYTSVTDEPGSANPIRTNGKIVVNSDNHTTGKEEAYTVDPDGTSRHLVGVGETGQWSRDGTRIAIGLDCCGGGIMNVPTGNFTSLHLDSLYPDSFLGCGVWSANGT